MVVLLDLVFCMKDNVCLFFLVLVILMVVFVVIGMLYGVNEMIFKGISFVLYELILFDLINLEN